MERQQRLVFGEVAETYDRLRPGYPAALIDHLAGLVPRGSTLLDVGCGTGKAGGPFIDRGFEVVGLEPDAQMAAIARERYPVVHQTDFEDWEGPPDSFAMVISGQAWHWVTPVVRVRRAHQLLRPGGWLALFWNKGALVDEGLAAAIHEVYETHAPSLRERAPLAAAVSDDDHDPADGLASTLFFTPQERTFEWERRMGAQDYVELLSTQSEHRLLPQTQLAKLSDAIRDAITRFGGQVVTRYLTLLWHAQKRAG
jgi:SAM-dependent methyltransferase